MGGMTDPPDPIQALLAGRRFEDLSAEEKATYRQLHEEEATQRTQAFVDNLNRNVLAKDGPRINPTLPDRVDALYRILADFPEAQTPLGPVLKPQAFVAFLDLRQLYEREIGPALRELQRLQKSR